MHESKFYLIGEGHKEFLADKTRDLDYYVLALAAIARELNIRKMTCGKIRIAAGLPLTWVSGQRDEFRDYLMQNKAVDFSFRNVSYHVEIVGVDVFPQGFAAVADRLSDFRGVNMICDIGNGTMNIMFINDKKPVSGNMFTEKYGTHQCLLAVRENVMRAHHTTVDEAIINRVFRFGTADIKEDYLKTITDTATDYVEGIFQRLREHEYNPELMRLYVLGGGSCLIRNFGVYDASRVTINDDICATAKGYVSLPVSMFGKGDFYILRAKGDSMVDAGIDEDDLLVIERNCPALEGDIVVALDEDNQNTLKRYAGYDKDSGYYILEYENEARYPGKTIKVRSFQVQGVARHVIKSL